MNNNPQGFNAVPENFAPPVFQPPAPQIPLKPKKVYSPLKKKDKVFLSLFALDAFVFADYFVGSMIPYGLGLTVFCLLQLIVSAAYFYDKNNKPSAFVVTCGVLSAVGSIGFTLFGDNLINSMLLVLVAGLYGLFCIGLSNRFSFETGSYKIVFDLVFDTFVKPFKSAPELFGAIKAGDKKEKKNLSALVGVLLAVPALIVIVPLLIKSDAAFEGLVQGLSQNVTVLVIKLIVTAVILPYFLFYAYSKKVKKDTASGAKKLNVRRAPYSAGVSFLSVISIVYVVYLFSQLAYFFSAFSGVLPDGYELTASAFARRGFYEMFAIGCINVGLVSLVLILCRRNEQGRLPLSLKLLSLFISVFDFVLLASAFAKMVMNVQRYDLSKNRVLVCVFMLMTAVVLTFFTIHIFAPKLPYMKSIVVICSVIFIAMSYCNINARIAEYNVREYVNSASASLDVSALSDLGDGAVESLVKIANDSTDVFSKEEKSRARAALRTIRDEHYELNFDNGKLKVSDLRSFNLSRYKAVQKIGDGPVVSDDEPLYNESYFNLT